MKDTEVEISIRIKNVEGLDGEQTNPITYVDGIVRLDRMGRPIKTVIDGAEGGKGASEYTKAVLENVARLAKVMMVDPYHTNE